MIAGLGVGWPDGRAPCRDLGAARGAELGENMRDVRRDCLGREYQLLRDLPVGEAGRDKLGDLEFARAERVPGLGLPRTLELGGEPAGRIDDGDGTGGGCEGAGFVQEDGRLAAAPSLDGGLGGG